MAQGGFAGVSVSCQEKGQVSREASELTEQHCSAEQGRPGLGEAGGASPPGIRPGPALGSCAASVAADGEGHLRFFLLLSERR